MSELLIDGRTLTPEQVEAVARGEATPRLHPEAKARMSAGAALWQTRGDPHLLGNKWSLFTGERRPPAREQMVQRFIASHCAGVGPALPREEVRALLLVRANVLAEGVSGCRPQVVERTLELLRRDWVPVVPSLGDVGAAGSVQLSHVARVLLGHGGELLVEGEIQRAAPLIQSLPPLQVTEKEALSLINGSSLATAMAALAVCRAERYLRAATASCGLAMEVVCASRVGLSLAAAATRGHPGIIEVTERLRGLVQGSELVTKDRAPDAFSVRCAPTVLGAATDTLVHVRTIVTRELNGAGDNPLIFEDEGVVEAGHFHGAPVALAMDHLKVAVAQVASNTERRIFRLTYGKLSGLPSFLLRTTGANSGLMLAQYTAASLVSEARNRCVPSAADAIPTVQHHEDHVSMGPVAARAALEVLDLLADIIAIELLCGAQGLDFRLNGEAVDSAGQLVQVPARRPGAGSAKVYAAVRALVTRWEDDRILHPELALLGRAVREGVFSEIS